MSESAVIVCKPTNWIKIRAALIIAMFSVFAYLFYKDGKVGYREQNVEVLYNSLFVTQAANQVDSFATETEWVDYAAEQTLAGVVNSDHPLPVDFDVTQKWPDSLVNGYKTLKESSGPQDLWLAFADERGWDAKPPEHAHDKGDLKVQFGMAYGSAAIALFVVIVLLRILSRNMKVTDAAYIAPGGKEVPFSAMRRIDARKWDNKGVATITYEQGGETLKAKVDGFLYGEFKEDDSQSATKLYEYILANFKGELIEFEKEDDSEDEESASPTQEEAKNSGEPVNS